jgi:hypothetical protein
MLAALALATLLAGPTTVEFIPTDDIWVYPHASDPQKDAYLRVWGAEGHDVAKDLGEMQDLSYSYLKFDLSTLPEGKITVATLTVTHISGPGYDLAYSKQNPLRARPLPPDFSEKGWDYSKAESILPEAGDKAILGTGFPETIPGGDKEFPIVVNLLKGPNDFNNYVKTVRASKAKAMALALTASLDVEESGQKCIYKFYSKDCENPAKRPVLKLTVEN